MPNNVLYRIKIQNYLWENAPLGAPFVKILGLYQWLQINVYKVLGNIENFKNNVQIT